MQPKRSRRPAPPALSTRMITRRHFSAASASLPALLFAGAGEAASKASATPADAVRELLASPDDRLDYARAKLAFDQVIDPSIDTARVAAELDRMARTASDMAGPGAAEGVKLGTLRTLIYESGSWNGGRPFGYDLADPYGLDTRNKLLATYLASRRGNCVSMPSLFLILADKMELPGTALAVAPLHFFIRYTNAAGRPFNLETTSGAHVTRDLWYREKMPMTDRAVESGLYLRALTRREAVASMAETIVEWLMQGRRFEEALSVCEVILIHHPHNAHIMVKQGTAYGRLLEVEFIEKYPTPDLIPPTLRARYHFLVEANRAAFEAAEALGWRENQTL